MTDTKSSAVLPQSLEKSPAVLEALRKLPNDPAIEKPCFDRLSTNGKSSTFSIPDPFALSLSKGEQRIKRPLSSSFRRAS
jgi:hypothetical protein